MSKIMRTMQMTIALLLTVAALARAQPAPCGVYGTSKMKYPMKNMPTPNA
jgi:hypothetical protein